MADLPFSLAALLGMANANSANGGGPAREGGTITLLTLPGRGLVGAAITPNGRSDDPRTLASARAVLERCFALSVTGCRLGAGLPIATGPPAEPGWPGLPCARGRSRGQQQLFLAGGGVLPASLASVVSQEDAADALGPLIHVSSRVSRERGPLCAMWAFQVASCA